MVFSVENIKINGYRTFILSLFLKVFAYKKVSIFNLVIYGSISIININQIKRPHLL